jgi:DNA-binding CsgD family transcriptional regulator
MGKSTLLAEAIHGAGELCVLRATGIDAESELPYAGLHQLLRPALSRIGRLPTYQADALRGAVGLSPARVEDRFAVSLAALNLLAETADETSGALVVVDDLQWLDQPSADALLFASRRLEAEGVAVLIACGPGGRRVDTAGFSDLRLTGLDDDAARALLLECAGETLSPAVAEQLLAIAKGNPLALCELPSSLTPGQLSGQEPLAAPLPVRESVESVFLPRMQRLTGPARDLLTLIAADEVDDWPTLRLAALLIDMEPTAIDELEARGMVVFDGRVVSFPQPLLRSVAYRTAGSARRRAAHLGLAEALEGGDSPDRRAWHLAAAAQAPDEEIAAELERSAARARLRSGHAVAAAALERAAELTKEEGERARRLVEAAGANWFAGRGRRTAMLLERAEPCITDESLRMTAVLLRGAYEFEHGSVESSYEILTQTAREVLADHPDQGLEMLMLARNAAWFSGRLERAVELGTLAASIPVSEEEGEAFAVDTLIGTAEVLRGDFEQGAAALRRALRIAETFRHPAHLLSASQAAVFLGDYAKSRRHLEDAIATLRATGALEELTVALQFEAGLDLWQGRFSSAAANGHEGLRLATETGQESSRAYLLAALAHVDCVRRHVTECRARATAALQLAATRGLVMHATFARWALGRLELGIGRPTVALEHFAAITDETPGESHPLMAMYATPDVVETAIRCGKPEMARCALARLEIWAERSGTAWSRAWIAALRAWLSPDMEHEWMAEALEIHRGQDLPYDEARARMLFAERLHDAGRDDEAREHARAAVVRFERMGAGLWALRVRAQLASYGEGTVTRPTPSPLHMLSPQEQQIARFVTSGATNRDIATKLFLSPSTISYHLRSIYLKLGIGSRAELTTVLGSDGSSEQTTVAQAIG